ncbi:TetR/AcrR family transcriptional regulator [Salinarimonas ramus]|uniref:TetR family transcriptional regulator n=1 Tax=Salinarimonas ramus TaxID=690164 RepID=A0A917V491_9HYPH|nr:TetR/AcrR family transcriptional regulator [Salinarimonas ramus]GGK35432.1 TetR family transcriptional regulator [Salinarimonas ramus]
MQEKTNSQVRKSARGRGRPSTLDEERALDAALDAFWRRGYAATDIDAVAAAAGTAKPSLYRRFGSKEGLFLAALERYAGGHGTQPLAAFAAERDIASAVRAFFRTAVEGQTTPGRPTGCLFACSAAPLAESQAAVGTLLADGTRAAHAALVARFEAASADGELPRGFPAAARAQLMLDAMQGLALRARAGADRAALLADARSYADVVLSPAPP